MNASEVRPPLQPGDAVLVNGEERTIAGEPFWLEDLGRWRVLTNRKQRGIQQYVDCDRVVADEQLGLPLVPKPD